MTSKRNIEKRIGALEGKSETSEVRGVTAEFVEFPVGGDPDDPSAEYVVYDADGDLIGEDP